MTDDLRWRKSSRSANNPNCVEMAHLGHRVAVRDSKNTDGPILEFSTAGLKALLDHVDEK
ncbi:DUF397 domain-containing protein [Labedaea rhizosphaerae]|uniref:Uncharacterized protein DUF397 n=1 Tax=Labedaea rhizosphaerae TaxID=598644 RepID=A0A4R6S426_LABRH|nr:DUF397 domain-containing protein [Labedaea rhizosphaerae]TDP93827.1 uncharacterized protein DUF397 [Labedaea rhizosphaerae]